MKEFAPPRGGFRSTYPACATRVKNGMARSELAPARLGRVHQLELDGCDSEKTNDGRLICVLLDPRPKISRRSNFRRLYRCKAPQRRYEGPWPFLCETMWSLTSPPAKRISGPKKFRSSAKKGFCNTIGAKRTFAESPCRLSAKGGSEAYSRTFAASPNDNCATLLETRRAHASDKNQSLRLL